MSQEEIRARIIAAQAAREKAADAANPRNPRAQRKPRSNWAASPPVSPARRSPLRGSGFGPKK